MARLQKFKGVDTLPGVGSPQVVADTAVGTATEKLGRQIETSTSKVSAWARKRQQQVNSLERAKATLKLEKDALEKLSEERSVSRPGAIGLTEAMLSHLEESARANTEDMQGEEKAQFEQDFEQQREQIAQHAAVIEASENEKYYQQGLADVGSFLVSIVRSHPDMIDSAFERAGTIVNTIPLPTQTKESGLRHIREQLAMSWVEQLPLSEQVDVLSALKISQNSRADRMRTEPASRGGNRAYDDVSGEQLSEIGESTGTTVQHQERLRHLQPHTRDKLLADALRQKSVVSVEEENQLAAQIANDTFAIGPQDILGNDKLEPDQRDRLLFRLEVETREQEENLAAVRWLGVTDDKHDAGSSKQELADRAFTYLDNGKTDRAALVRTIYLKKGKLPSPYRKSLSSALSSADATSIDTAFEDLVELDKIAPEVVTGSDGERQFDLALTKFKILTEQLGLNREDAAARLANANAPGRRKELLSEFEDQSGRGNNFNLDASNLLSFLGKLAR